MSETHILRECLGGLSLTGSVLIKKLLKRINLLIRDIQRIPYEGVGKPESLKHGLSGYWFRRVNDQHRIVYKIEGDAILIVQIRYHY